jgi:large subunit ribosomal protein L35
MPKLKTHKGTAKRIKLTKNGKVMRERAYGNHLLSKKSKGRKRKINTPARIQGKLAKNVKRAIGAKK